jgi:hypothetical protein
MQQLDSKSHQQAKPLSPNRQGFTLSPSGEVKFEGEAPSNIKVVERVLASSDYYRQLEDKARQALATDQKIFMIAHYGFLGSLALCVLILGFRALTVHQPEQENNVRQYVRGTCPY